MYLAYYRPGQFPFPQGRSAGPYQKFLGAHSAGLARARRQLGEHAAAYARLRRLGQDDNVDLSNLPLTPGAGTIPTLTPGAPQTVYVDPSMLTPADTIPTGQNYKPQPIFNTSPSTSIAQAVNQLLTPAATTTAAQYAAAPGISSNTVMLGAGALLVAMMLASSGGGRRR